MTHPKLKRGLMNCVPVYLSQVIAPDNERDSTMDIFDEESGNFSPNKKARSEGSGQRAIHERSGI
jgi:hypothetical protein